MEILLPEMQWQFGPPGTSVNVRTKDGGVEEVHFEGHGMEEVGHVEKVGFLGKNTARVYEAFAMGEKGKYADFGDAVVRHEMLDLIVQSAT